ncbi:hypothetical protein LPJ63_004932 [Coemansia sp. RSA 2711]|nr:hypothetical protein LPJ63_004932 [Coemansia sp. RSA 2711]
MTAELSLAQRLPANIIARTAGYIPQRTPGDVLAWRAWIDVYRIRPLSAIVAVCRSWRAAALSELFRLAMLRLTGDEGDGRPYIHALDLAEVFERGRRHCVRSLVIRLDTGRLRLWPPGNTGSAELAAEMRELGQLLQVRRVHIEFRAADKTAELKELAQRADSETQAQIGRGVADFIDGVCALAPNAKEIGTNGMYWLSPMDWFGFSDAMLGRLSELERAHVAHMRLVYARAIPSDLQLCRATGSLQSLEIHDFEYRPDITAQLIQRNAATLERLYIESGQYTVLDWILWSEGGQQACVQFPRLTRLVINWVYMEGRVPDWQILETPYPRLQVLVCRAQHPRSFGAVLFYAQQTLDYLQMSISFELAMQLRARGLARGAYTGLRSVWLRWQGNHQNEHMSVSDAVITGLDLGCCVHRLHLELPYIADFGMVLAGSCAAAMLQQLEIVRPRLSIADLLAILGGCPQLDKLSVSLLPGKFKRRSPRESELRGIIEQHAYVASSVRWFRMQADDFTSMESAVTLATVAVYYMPGVARVCIPWLMQVLLDRFDSVCRWGVYGGRAHMAGVRACRRACW